ncbi:hypothetical protein ACE6H2_020141 [Prunus campanulata]
MLGSFRTPKKERIYVLMPRFVLNYTDELFSELELPHFVMPNYSAKGWVLPLIINL